MQARKTKRRKYRREIGLLMHVYKGWVQCLFYFRLGKAQTELLIQLTRGGGGEGSEFPYGGPGGSLRESDRVSPGKAVFLVDG